MLTSSVKKRDVRRPLCLCKGDWLPDEEVSSAWDTTCSSVEHEILLVRARSWRDTAGAAARRGMEDLSCP